MTKTIGLLSEIELPQEKISWEVSDILKFIKFDLTPIYLTEEDYLKLSFHLKSFANRRKNKPTKNQIQNLLRTRPIDKKSPDLYCRALLTSNQYNKLIDYLVEKQYYQNSFGKEVQTDAVLAFSFGKNPDVNRELARKLEELNSTDPNLQIFAQYEIYELIQSKRKFKDIIKLGDRRYKYISTGQIADKFLAEYQKPIKEITLVAQAWHAPRCMEICFGKGINAVRGEFVDKFSPSDSQPWVRDVLSWVIKEAQK
jgi:hypothetical protein